VSVKQGRKLPFPIPMPLGHPPQLDLGPMPNDGAGGSGQAPPAGKEKAPTGAGARFRGRRTASRVVVRQVLYAAADHLANAAVADRAPPCGPAISFRQLARRRVALGAPRLMYSPRQMLDRIKDHCRPRRSLFDLLGRCGRRPEALGFAFFSSASGVRLRITCR
jgi:hypothetical protein